MLALALGSACFYVMATYAMKHWANHATTVALLAIALTLSGAVFCEVLALRSERMGYLYVAILGFECILVAVISVVFEGETYSARELAGLAGIVVGVALMGT